MGICGFARVARPRARAGRWLAVTIGAATLILSIQSLSPLRAAEAKSPSLVLSEADPSPELTQLQSKFQTVADRVAPAVVAISATVTAIDSDDALRNDDINAQKLDALLEGVTRTVGTGFVLSADGYIVTNEHVIADAAQVWVTTDDRKVFPAIVVGSDPRADLAVLKIPADHLSPVRFARDPVNRGQWTVALGNPFGLAGVGEMAMSVGVVSATNRSLPKLSTRENRLYANLIQTTAQINPGNSGGPLFDLAGEVIGITTAVVMPQKQTNGIGFAMPVTETLLAKLRDLKDGREIVYGYIGVVVSNATARQRRDAGVANTDVGVHVDSVEKDSPAEAAGLKAGDLLLSIGARPARESDEFVRLIGEMPVDRPASIRLIRGREARDLDVTPARRATPNVPVTRALQRFRWRGLLLGPVPANLKADTAAAAAVARATAGVMVFGVEPASQFAKDGVASGSIITALDGTTVTDLFSFQRMITDTPAERCKLTLAPASDNIASAK
jgi:serine protease Do